jgi:hypothetical protein
MGVRFLQFSWEDRDITLVRNLTMNESTTTSQRAADKVEVSIQLDSDLLEQIESLTGDPSKVIEAALRQWLRRETTGEGELARTLRRNPPVPPRGEWND